MAKVIKGRHKGSEVTIMDVQGEFAIIESSRKVRLGMLECTPAERRLIQVHYAESETFKLWYDWGFFLKTGRFKRIAWARA